MLFPFSACVRVRMRVRVCARARVCVFYCRAWWGCFILYCYSSFVFDCFPTVPSPPSSIQSDHVSLRPTSFVLKWQSGIGIFQRYHVIVRDASSSEVMLDRQLDQSHSMVMVTGLEPDTKYACAITTISGGRRGRQESDVVLVNVRTGEWKRYVGFF